MMNEFRRGLGDVASVNMALLPLLALAFGAAFWVGFGAKAVGPVLLWCVACLSVGGMVGFLFGIPRSGLWAARPGDAGEGVGSAGPTPRKGGPALARPNTNLEEVSDWLTKIIVGLSLVHFNDIEKRVQSITGHAASALSAAPTDADRSAATAMVVGITVIGFLCGYLYTRLFLQGAFVRSNDFSRVVEEEQRRLPPANQPEPGQPTVPSASERRAARRVLMAAPADRPDAVLAPLQELGDEYKRIREVMPNFSRERTRRMTEVFTQMQPLTLAARPYTMRLASSASEGDRLAAVAILKMQFDPDYIEWLAERLDKEAAFIGYQAASALLVRVQGAGVEEKTRIKAAVAAAKARIPWPEKQRDDLIEKILAA